MRVDGLLLGEFTLWIIVWIFVGIWAVVAFLVTLEFANLWISAFMGRTGIGYYDLIAMRLRKANTKKIVNAAIVLVQSGIANLDVRRLEAHDLAGGDVEAVAKAMLAAKEAGVSLDFGAACAVDLAGGDLMQVAREGLGLAGTAEAVRSPGFGVGKVRKGGLS